jgi:hypothetical protein
MDKKFTGPMSTKDGEVAHLSSQLCGEAKNRKTAILVTKQDPISKITNAENGW